LRRLPATLINAMPSLPKKKPIFVLKIKIRRDYLRISATDLKDFLVL